MAKSTSNFKTFNFPGPILVLDKPLERHLKSGQSKLRYINKDRKLALRYGQIEHIGRPKKKK